MTLVTVDLVCFCPISWSKKQISTMAVHFCDDGKIEMKEGVGGGPSFRNLIGSY